MSKLINEDSFALLLSSANNYRNEVNNLQPPIKDKRFCRVYSSAPNVFFTCSFMRQNYVLISGESIPRQRDAIFLPEKTSIYHLVSNTINSFVFAVDRDSQLNDFSSLPDSISITIEFFK